jgi:hypothetical protein
MGKRRWSVNITCTEAETEALYLRLHEALALILQEESYISKCAQVLLENNHISNIDIIHHAFLSHIKHNKSNTKYVRNADAIKFGARTSPDNAIRFSIQDLVDDYIKEHEYREIKLQENELNRIDIDMDTIRTILYAEITGILTKVDPEVIWNVLSRYKYFKLVSDGLIEDSLYRFNLKDIKKVVVLSDYLVAKLKENL